MTSHYAIKIAIAVASDPEIDHACAGLRLVIPSPLRLALLLRLLYLAITDSQ